MGGGCKQFNAYERWYMQWLSGCNGVRVPSTGTFNLMPLESNCSDGSGVQVLQVPFPATLPVNDPQSTSTAVNLNNYYVELRTAGGIFDTYSTSTRGTAFSGPTVFIYVSDNVRALSGTGRGQNSVWTELLNMSPSGTAYTGLTAAGQSFVDPAGGPTIKLESISATGASVSVTYPNGGSGSPTCIDGTPLTAPGPSSCAGGPPATGGGGATTATGGTTGTGAAGRSGDDGYGRRGRQERHVGHWGRERQRRTQRQRRNERDRWHDDQRHRQRRRPRGQRRRHRRNRSGQRRDDLARRRRNRRLRRARRNVDRWLLVQHRSGHPVPRTAVWLSLAVGLALARVRRRNQRGAA